MTAEPRWISSKALRLLHEESIAEFGGVRGLRDEGLLDSALARPQNAIALLLLVLSGVVHMRLGMQTIIEDYVHAPGRRIAATMLNAFFAAGVAITCVFAVLKLSFGG